MPNELQVVISVLTAGKPDEVNETYLQRKLDLSPDAFAQQYSSFSHLLQACSRYCYQAVKTELDVVWQLATHALQKLFYSLVVLQRPENQKRRRYLELVEQRLPTFAEDLRLQMLDFIQDHFQRLLIQGQAEELLQPNLSPAITANRLWHLNSTILWQSIQSDAKTYWLNEVVLELWPLIVQLFTNKGQQLMAVSLPPSHSQTFNQYG